MSPIVEVDSLEDERPAVPAFVARILAHAGGDRDAFRQSLTLAIGEIDRRLRAQAGAILAHPDFRALETAWRSLRWVVRSKPVDEKVAVRVLNLSRKELQADLEDAIEFDRSQLFRLLYEEEFGRLGGEPFSVVVADFEFAPHHEDVAILRDLSGIAAAAHAVLLTGASPEILGLATWRSLTVGAIPERVASAAWQSLRTADDTRYLGLVMPRMLLREPYDPRDSRHWLRLDESASPRAPGDDARLWGNAGYALAVRAMMSFHLFRWPVAIRGLEGGYGVVENLPREEFETDSPGLVVKPPVETCITEAMEKGLVDIGIVPLCRVANTPEVAFFSVPSLHQPRVVDDPAVAINLKLSSQLPYMLAASRVAHYIKAIMRDHVGSFTSKEEIQRRINDWLVEYTLDDANASAEKQAQYPLRAFDVQVREKPGRPGELEAITQLRPHFQLEDPNVSLRLAIDLPDPGKTRR
ncbi:MAG: type VI secretion system contractile sheath large subunit [Planctomycetes bacterium]|nr:type VI secretion system contractile sheath large subunit [Planctomycetota bacterium]